MPENKLKRNKDNAHWLIIGGVLHTNKKLTTKAKTKTKYYKGKDTCSRSNMRFDYAPNRQKQIEPIGPVEVCKSGQLFWLDKNLVQQYPIGDAPPPIENNINIAHGARLHRVLVPNSLRFWNGQEDDVMCVCFVYL